jgi:isopentenyldiphosphate isomerase
MTKTHTYPPVVVVDEEDNEVGVAPLTEVWKKGLYHRIVSVFVTDDQERMLLQLRGPNVGIYPNCWDQAAAGHVDEGFTYDEAAKAELAEETGLHDVSLEILGTLQIHKTLDDGRIINQFERVYLAHVPHDIRIKPEAAEVAKLQWFSKIELKQEMTDHPEKFTEGLLDGLHTYFPDYNALD